MNHNDARIVYEDIVNRPDAPRPMVLENIKQIVDDAWNDMHRNARLSGLTCPADDRAEEIVTAMFAYLAEANGYWNVEVQGVMK